jgi:hypothetical protein
MLGGRCAGGERFTVGRSVSASAGLNTAASGLSTRGLPLRPAPTSDDCLPDVPSILLAQAALLFSIKAGRKDGGS